MFPDVVTLTVFCAGLCTLLAVVISVRHINSHLTNYIAPEFQLHIVRILAMVPIYSLTSWFALFTKSESITLVLDLIRDSYEAYVIYNFVILLINYGGGHLHLCRYLEDQPRMDHSFPFHYYLPPLKLGPNFLSNIRVCLLQFVFVKPCNAIFNLYLHFELPRSSLRTLLFITITIVNNVSISIALYALILFYHATESLLKPYHPFEKFIAVKAVIFFSFWQGFALSILNNIGIIKDMPGFTADEQTSGLQDVLICVEMAVAAIAHLFVFSWHEYIPYSHQHGSHQAHVAGAWGHASKHPLLQILDLRDVLSDAKDRFDGASGSRSGFENELVDDAPIVVPRYELPGDSSSSRYLQQRQRQRQQQQQQQQWSNYGTMMQSGT